MKLIQIATSLLLILFFSCNGCKESNIPHHPNPENDITVVTDEVINDCYIGNGAQWDPYPNAYWNWKCPVSESDWNKMYSRLDYMRPQLMRVITTSGWAYGRNGGYDPTLGLEPLSNILDYCNRNHVTVIFGEWGGGLVNASENIINEEKLTNAAKYLSYLVNDKGYSCIKYYNLVNEPNGDWSAIKGNYDLWKRAVSYFLTKMDELNLSSKVSIMAPDIAIFSTNLTNWIDLTAIDFGNRVSVFDIHTYPGQTLVREKNYTSLIKAYKDRIPQGCKMVVSEMGFKYDRVADKTLYERNETLRKADVYASNTDGNMMVKEFFYGIDMADATMQMVNTGFSGMVAWMLDDAMHNTDGVNDKELKIWGFWNILGEELFGGPQEEELRPWFYSFSLLSRYMQTGAKILKLTIPEKKGLNAIAVTKEGKYMIAIVNSGYPEYSINLKFSSKEILNGVKRFIYSEANRPVDNNGFPTPVEQNLSLNLDSGYSLNIEGQTLIVLTNFDY